MPRFYFVGDEDLLEIIGNSKNVPKLQKHFKKMFAGVASVILNDDDTLVLGISSREGEQVYNVLWLAWEEYCIYELALSMSTELLY